jgi:hypothetical protein
MMRIPVKGKRPEIPGFVLPFARELVIDCRACEPGKRPVFEQRDSAGERKLQTDGQCQFSSDRNHQFQFRYQQRNAIRLLFGATE